jgi:hypothetical protein
MIDCLLKVIPCVKPPADWPCWREIHWTAGLGDNAEDIAHYLKFRGIPVPNEVYIDRGGNILVPIEKETA